VPALVDAGPVVLTFGWLYTFAFFRPLIADVIFERALATGYTKWDLGGENVDATVSGCFGPDGGSLVGPDQLIEWRLTALAAAGRHGKLITPGPDWGRVARARPSDALLLSVDVDGSAPWLDPVELVPLAHLVRAARRIGRSASEIASRLEGLGYSAAVGHGTAGVGPDGLVLLSRDLDGSRPWLDPSQSVVLPHLLKAAQRTGRPVGDIVARLTRVGLQIDGDIAVLPVETLDPADLILASRDLDGSFPWLDQTEPAPLVHLVRVAHRLQRDIADVAARLAVLGYPFTPGCEALHTESDDLVLISRDLDGASPWLDPAEAVCAVHLVRASEKAGRAVA